MNNEGNGPKVGRQYTIAIAARTVGLSQTRIRPCVQVGLVTPAGTEGGAPYFGEPELARLRRVRRLAEDLGLNMAGIEVTMRLLDEVANLRAMLRRGDGSRGGDREQTSE